MLTFLIDNSGMILLTIGGFMIVVILVRETLTWYWKINKVVELLEKIEENTRPRKIIEKASEEQKIKI